MRKLKKTPRPDIKIRLLKLGRTVTELAQRMGISRSTLNFYVNGYNKRGVPKHRERQLQEILRNWEYEFKVSQKFKRLA